MKHPNPIARRVGETAVLNSNSSQCPNAPALAATPALATTQPGGTNKLVSFLTALALTAAALVSPSALAYVGIVFDNTDGGTVYGIAVDVANEEDAIAAARQNCMDIGGSEDDCMDSNLETRTSLNICVGVYASNEGIRTLLTHQTRQAAISPGVCQDLLRVVPDATECTIPDLSQIDICDGTCTGLSVRVNNENYEAGCQAAAKDADCQTIAERDGTDPNVKYFDEDTETCREALECLELNHIPNSAGGCNPCPNGTAANPANNGCEAVCTADNEVANEERTCIPCRSDEMQNADNSACIKICDGNNEIRDGDGNCEPCASGERANIDNNACEAIPAAGSSSSVNNTGIVIGAVLFGLFITNADVLSANSFHWTPSYAYDNDNGNISYSLGSRWTARTDNWRYYWQTAQTDGEFRYGSGVDYHNGIFAATMDSESNSDKTDLDLSLSATKAAGLWQFNGGYSLDAILSETADSEMHNHLNIAARYSLDKWILSATANTDGDTTAAKINYSYRF